VAIIGYDMQIDDGHNGDFRFVLGGDRSANTLATSVILTPEDGLVAGLDYRVRYRAINEIGEGPWSDSAYIRATTLPYAPPSPTVTSYSASSINFFLGRTEFDGGTIGGPAFFYKLWTNEGGDDTPFHLVSNYDGSSLTYTITAADTVEDDLGNTVLTFEAGKIYTLKLTAENEVGDSEERYPAPTVRVAFGGSPATPT